MNEYIAEDLDRMCDVLNQHYGDISFRDYKNFYNYYNHILSLNIGDDYNEYCKYIIEEVMIF